MKRPVMTAEERDAQLFAQEFADLIAQGLIVVEDPGGGAPARYGVAAAIADIEAGRV